MVTAACPFEGLRPDEEFEPLLGLEIGRSTARIVYECVGFPQFVIKQAIYPGAFSNSVEYFIWQQIKDEHNIASVLGHCPARSYSAKYLLMERLDDVPDDQKTLRRCPPWVTDRKPSNFGVSQSNEVKMRDFGNVKLGDFLARYQNEPIS